jgi:protein-disulfide isomerase
VNALFEQVLEKNADTVKLVFKNFPIRSHKFALKAATAVMAAHRQGKFWELHDLLFANYNKLSDEKIDELVGQLELDGEKFKKDREDPAVIQQVRRDYADGIKAGVRGTPSVFINGRLVKNRSPAGIQALIDAELARRGEG